MKYHLVEYANRYIIKTENNIMCSNWHKTIEQAVNNPIKPKCSSNSTLLENRILLTCNELPTYTYVLQNYPELLI